MADLQPISIKVKGLRKVFGATTALEGAELVFEEGLMHGVIGPEGAGKTTLMRIMLGLLKPNSGEIIYRQGGECVDFEAVRAGFAYMPQQQSLYPDLSIGEHLDFFKALYGIPEDLYAEKRE